MDPNMKFIVTISLITHWIEPAIHIGGKKLLGMIIIENTGSEEVLKLVAVIHKTTVKNG